MSVKEQLRLYEDDLLHSNGLLTKTENDDFWKSYDCHFSEKSIKAPDFAERKIVTVDSEDTKDLDDAFSLYRDETGYHLEVYITDLSPYLYIGSPVNEMICEAGISQYLITQKIPMLPEALSFDLCSLLPGQMRHAILIGMDFDKTGILQSHRIEKAVIRSDLKTSYREVNDFFLTGSSESIVDPEIREMLLDMAELSKLRHRNREKVNAVKITEREPEIVITDDSIELMPYAGGLADTIVQEFMICANELMADFFYQNHIIGFYRIKMPSSNAMGYEFRRHILDKEQKRYMHFTSPIRRYPDLINGLILSEYLSGCDTDDLKMVYEPYLTKIQKKLNETLHQAREIERSCTNYAYRLYFEERMGEIFEGQVSKYDRNHRPFVKIDLYNIHIPAPKCPFKIGECVRFRIDVDPYNHELQAYDITIK